VELGQERKKRKFSEGIASAQENSAKGGAMAEIVADVIETEGGDRADVLNLAQQGREAVWDGWYDADYFDKPASTVVAKVCKDLGVAVDWSRWEGEDWTMEEVGEEIGGSPFVKAAAGDAAANGSGAFDVSGSERQATGPP